MSTRATVVYFPDKHLHIYHELFVDDAIYFRGEFDRARMESHTDPLRVDVTLRFSQADFDMLVDAYVAERERRKASTAERLERQVNCPKHEAKPMTPEVARWFWPSCKHCGAEMPPATE